MQSSRPAPFMSSKNSLSLMRHDAQSCEIPPLIDASQRTKVLSESSCPQLLVSSSSNLSLLQSRGSVVSEPSSFSSSLGMAAVRPTLSANGSSPALPSPSWKYSRTYGLSLSALSKSTSSHASDGHSEDPKLSATQIPVPDSPTPKASSCSVKHFVRPQENPQPDDVVTSGADVRVLKLGGERHGYSSEPFYFQTERDIEQDTSPQSHCGSRPLVSISSQVRTCPAFQKPPDSSALCAAPIATTRSFVKESGTLQEACTIDSVTHLERGKTASTCQNNDVAMPLETVANVVHSNNTCSLLTEPPGASSLGSEAREAIFPCRMSPVMSSTQKSFEQLPSKPLSTEMPPITPAHEAFKPLTSGYFKASDESTSSKEPRFETPEEQAGSFLMGLPCEELNSNTVASGTVLDCQSISSLSSWSSKKPATEVGSHCGAPVPLVSLSSNYLKHRDPNLNGISPRLVVAPVIPATCSTHFSQSTSGDACHKEPSENGSQPPSYVRCPPSLALKPLRVSPRRRVQVGMSLMLQQVTPSLVTTALPAVQNSCSAQGYRQPSLKDRQLELSDNGCERLASCGDSEMRWSQSPYGTRSRRVRSRENERRSVAVPESFQKESERDNRHESSLNQYVASVKTSERSWQCLQETAGRNERVLDTNFRSPEMTCKTNNYATSELSVSHSQLVSSNSASPPESMQFSTKAAEYLNPYISTSERKDNGCLLSAVVAENVQPINQQQVPSSCTITEESCGSMGKSPASLPLPSLYHTECGLSQCPANDQERLEDVGASDENFESSSCTILQKTVAAFPSSLKPQQKAYCSSSTRPLRTGLFRSDSSVSGAKSPIVAACVIPNKREAHSSGSCAPFSSQPQTEFNASLSAVYSLNDIDGPKEPTEAANGVSELDHTLQQGSTSSAKKSETDRLLKSSRRALRPRRSCRASMYSSDACFFSHAHNEDIDSLEDSGACGDLKREAAPYRPSPQEMKLELYSESMDSTRKNSFDSSVDVGASRNLMKPVDSPSPVQISSGEQPNASGLHTEHFGEFFDEDGGGESSSFNDTGSGQSAGTWSGSGSGPRGRRKHRRDHLKMSPTTCAARVAEELPPGDYEYPKLQFSSVKGEYRVRFTLNGKRRERSFSTKVRGNAYAQAAATTLLRLIEGRCAGSDSNSPSSSASVLGRPTLSTESACATTESLEEDDEVSRQRQRVSYSQCLSTTSQLSSRSPVSDRGATSRSPTPESVERAIQDNFRMEDVLPSLNHSVSDDSSLALSAPESITGAVTPDRYCSTDENRRASPRHKTHHTSSKDTRFIEQNKNLVPAVPSDLENALHRTLESLVMSEVSSIRCRNVSATYISNSADSAGPEVTGLKSAPNLQVGSSCCLAKSTANGAGAPAGSSKHKTTMLPDAYYGIKTRTVPPGARSSKKRTFCYTKNKSEGAKKLTPTDCLSDDNTALQQFKEEKMPSEALRDLADSLVLPESLPSISQSALQGVVQARSSSALSSFSLLPSSFSSSSYYSSPCPPVKPWGDPATCAGIALDTQTDRLSAPTTASTENSDRNQHLGTTSSSFSSAAFEDALPAYALTLFDSLPPSFSSPRLGCGPAERIKEVPQEKFPLSDPVDFGFLDQHADGSLNSQCIHTISNEIDRVSSWQGISSEKFGDQGETESDSLFEDLGSLLIATPESDLQLQLLLTRSLKALIQDSSLLCGLLQDDSARSITSNLTHPRCGPLSKDTGVVECSLDDEIDRTIENLDVAVDPTARIGEAETDLNHLILDLVKNLLEKPNISSRFKVVEPEAVEGAGGGGPLPRKTPSPFMSSSMYPPLPLARQSISLGFQNEEHRARDEAGFSNAGATQDIRSRHVCTSEAQVDFQEQSKKSDKVLDNLTQTMQCNSETVNRTTSYLNKRVTTSCDKSVAVSGLPAGIQESFVCKKRSSSKRTRWPFLDNMETHAPLVKRPKGGFDYFGTESDGCACSTQEVTTTGPSAVSQLCYATEQDGKNETEDARGPGWESDSPVLTGRREHYTRLLRPLHQVNAPPRVLTSPTVPLAAPALASRVIPAPASAPAAVVAAAAFAASKPASSGEFDPFARRPEFRLQPPSDGYCRQAPALTLNELYILRKTSGSVLTPKALVGVAGTKVPPHVSINFDNNGPAWVLSVRYFDWAAKRKVATTEFSVPIADMSPETVGECFSAGLLYCLESERYTQLTAAYLKREGGWSIVRKA